MESRPHKRKLFALLSLTVVSCLLAGCGPKEEKAADVDEAKAKSGAVEGGSRDKGSGLKAPPAPPP